MEVKYTMMVELPVVKPDDFYTRDELVQFFPKRTLIKKRHTFEAENANCIYGDILVDLSGEIIPEKLLASMLLYIKDRDTFCEDSNISFMVGTYGVSYEYKPTNGSNPIAILITLLRKSHRKMSCLCHLWLARLLGAKRFECQNHGESGKIPGNHKLFSKYGMDTKTSHNDLVNWVVANSKPVMPFIAADNKEIDNFFEEAKKVTDRLGRVLKFFMEFCHFDETEIDYLLTVIDPDIDMVNLPTMNPDILPDYLQEKYKAALMGRTNAKGECSTCYLKEFTRVNCVIHTEIRIRDEQPPTMVAEASTEVQPLELELKPKVPEETDSTQECTICCDKKPTHVAVPCGHAYCGSCIGKIYKENKSCAFCKRTMTFPMEILWN